MNPSQDYLDSLSHKIERNTLKEVFDHYDKIHETDYSEHLKQSAETLVSTLTSPASRLLLWI